MSDETPGPDFSAVASETPEESVRHEHEATDLIEEEAVQDEDADPEELED